MLLNTLQLFQKLSYPLPYGSAYSAFFTTASQSPPKYGFEGGLNFHSILSWTITISPLFMNMDSSFCDPVFSIVTINYCTSISSGHESVFFEHRSFQLQFPILPFNRMYMHVYNWRILYAYSWKVSLQPYIWNSLLGSGKPFLE